MTPTADRNRRIGGCGTRVIDQACPWERVLYCYFSAPGVLCHFEKAHPNAPGVPYYRAKSNKKKQKTAGGEVPGEFSDVAVVSLLCVVRFGSGCWMGEFVGAMPHAPVVLGSPGNIRERQRRRRRINVRGEVQA